MKKKELAEEMKTMYDFPYVHIHRRFDVFPVTIRETLLGFYMFRVDNKSTRTRYERCLKLKLKK